ncbi:Recombination hotspot-binding protein (Translin) [Rasamsonia emersonii CBS 393.64]|uniref:Recombination hotspot-binding protein (Translin) n=1 Tax=Rasamsonia emersonii (strain ATCC 16479 / CBS 393.64 / IMI 116815) TaxID=1408163 RepID=A0A0F4YM28_RASE3|nr:Recombination hotspot-binding protein (Translin) [Rasamsonia emersonii CBS 393.64]KKA19150.1 Recombination hotspot-binding protein (Translin) [Rasamsonia emersonii CBS 393.64]
MIDPAIFEQLQAKIDEETAVRDELHDIVQSLARKGRTTQATLSRAHSTPEDQSIITIEPLCLTTWTTELTNKNPIDTDMRLKVKPILDEAAEQIRSQKEDVSRLAYVASHHPFYKYNGVWTRELQNLVFSIELCAWLGGLSEYKGANSSFLTIEEVGKFLDVPVNLKGEDAFHLTIEEYLLALISLVEELNDKQSRLAVNSVTLGDYHRPLQINAFIKDLFAGFQLLNLKNDILRKRSDGIKYSVGFPLPCCCCFIHSDCIWKKLTLVIFFFQQVKKVEDVVYDLSLRNLIPKGSAAV